MTQHEAYCIGLRRHFPDMPCSCGMGRRWGVWCVVAGGVTGHREGWLKKNGERWEFPTREAAELEAARLQKDANGPHATARFSYEPAEL